MFPCLYIIFSSEWDINKKMFSRCLIFPSIIYEGANITAGEQSNDKIDWFLLNFHTYCIRCFIVTLDPSWRFSSAEILASLNLQDGPQSGYISLQNHQPTHPPIHPPDHLTTWPPGFFSHILDLGLAPFKVYGNNLPDNLIYWLVQRQRIQGDH